MGSLKENGQTRGKSPLFLRIGLHSGRVVADNVKFRERFKYTVVGDAANLVQRLGNISKFYGSGIVISEATHHLVKETFLIRELDHVLVKGRTQSVIIYELLGYLPPDGAPYPRLDLFVDGLAAYRQRDWAQAREKFQEALHLNPNDAPTRLYLERSIQFLKEPPPVTWQGIPTLDTTL